MPGFQPRRSRISLSQPASVTCFPGDGTDPSNGPTAMGRAFAIEKGLGEWEEEFAKGAMIAQNPLAFESLPLLGDEDRNIMRDEVLHRWRQPFTVSFTLADKVFITLLCAEVDLPIRSSTPSSSAAVWRPPSRAWTSPSRTELTSSGPLSEFCAQRCREIRPLTTCLTFSPFSFSQIWSRHLQQRAERRIQPMDSRSRQRRAVPLLRGPRLLAHRPAQQLARSSRHDLRHRHPLRSRLHLVRMHQLALEPIRCPIRSRSRNR